MTTPSVAETIGQTPSVGVNLRAGERAERRMLVGGRLRETDSGETFSNISPATGEVIGSTTRASASDMDAAIGAARSAFDDTAWSTDRALRKRCLLQLQEALVAEQEELREELIAEAGAPVMSTYMAHLDWPLSDALVYPAELIDRFEWERELAAGTAIGNTTSRRVYKEPVGVVAAIAPWNYPFEIVSNKLGQALATGNTVVLKPDPNTPWSSLRIGRLIAEHTDIPSGVVNVVPTPDNSVAELLVTDPRVDMISFTGSTDVGRLIARKGAATLKRVFLELGGKSAMVLLEDADLESALPNALGVCFHAGQGCAVPTRALVPQRLYDEYVAGVSAMFGGIAPGDPASPDTFLGPVINSKQRDRILGYIRRAESVGAKIVTGGNIPTDMDPALAGGNFLLPTLVAGVDNSHEIARHEVFGPVLVVLPYRDEADALRIANDSDYGLSGMVLSRSESRAREFAGKLRSGTVNINGGLFYGADAPYGGYKTSGTGRQNGIEGFEQHLETKVVAFG